MTLKLTADDPKYKKLMQQLIGQHLSSSKGRIALAASMALPLMQRRDYESIGRKFFMVEALPDGDLPIYGKKVKVPLPTKRKKSEVNRGQSKGKNTLEKSRHKHKLRHRTGKSRAVSKKDVFTYNPKSGLRLPRGKRK
jgi:hypothetical protein